jgi:hypothetical protein
VLLVGTRVHVIADDDDTLDGKAGTIILLPNDSYPYYEVVLDNPPKWTLRMFPDSGIPLTEKEVKAC